MPVFATLQDYIVIHLRSAAIVPLPEKEEWKAHVERICLTGRINEVTEEDYYYWLEVLPPKYQGAGFAFAEGAEPLRYFWHKQGRYFARQLTQDETVTFCRLARIPLPH